MKRFLPLFHQLKRFVLTGMVNTVFGYLVYAFGVAVLDWSYVSALVLSYAAGISFSYTTFRAFVFTEGNRGWKSYRRFVPVYVVLLALNMAALHELVDIMGWNKLVAQAVVVPFCAMLSFIINRLFVFREKKA